MKTLGYVALACGLAGQAFAGGIAEPTPEPVVVVTAEPAASFDWTGFYAGVSATDGDGAAATFSTGTGGYGVHVGYLHDLGSFALGGELAYSKADLDDLPGTITSTSVKVIGGYSAGRFLPYAFVGLSDVELSGAGLTFSDTVTNYGLGARYAFGADGKFVGGLEYIVEDKSNFGGTGFALDYDEVALRFDYRF